MRQLGVVEVVDEVVKEFLVESGELLDQLDGDFVQLERQPDDTELLAKIFRCLHTIKGGTGFLGFPRLESLTHAGESLLAQMRDGNVKVDREVIKAIYELAESCRSALEMIESTGSDEALAIESLVATLGRLRETKRADAPDPEPSTGGSVDTTVAAAAAVAVPEAAEAPTPPAVAPAAEGSKPTDRRSMGEILVAKGLARPEDLVHAARLQRGGDPRRIGEILVERGIVKPEEIRAALEQQGEESSTATVEGSIRVDVGLLDKLMNLVGELVLARNQIQQHTQRHESLELCRASARLDLITTELQAGVMKTRMQPVRNVWSKFPRVVRHLGVVCDKRVRVEMEGQDTELDKTIIEALRDPLTHFVRNTVDHGIESPDERRRVGKPEEGVVSLRAFHEGGHVNMEIADDGRGVDVDKVRARALERGIINAVQAASLSDREITNLVFEPGFSTADQVTNVSGRGVGMDVVRTNIERVGGTCDLISQRGQGTTLKIKIPLTLAIIPAILVRSGGGSYALPQVSLLELVRLDGRAGARQIEWIGSSPVYRLRGKLLPLVNLNAELRLPATSQPEQLTIVVLQADDRTFGLVVDEVKDTAEIVVKPLGRALKSLGTFAGATILGDGSVGLILDVLGLAMRARVIEEVRERGRVENGAGLLPDASNTAAGLMVVRLGNDRRFAVDLDRVHRLEEFAASSIECAGGREVVQYRKEILPLLRLAPTLAVDAEGGCSHGSDETLSVLVADVDGQRVGLVVDEILDIVPAATDAGPVVGCPGIRGSAVIDGRVTDLVDLRAVLRLAGLGLPVDGHRGAA